MNTTPEPIAYRVPQAAQRMNRSRSRIYELIRSGELKSFLEGRTRLITETAIRAYYAQLEQEQNQEQEGAA